MKCESVKQQLPLYVGSDLQEQEMGRIREHLDTCSSCAREFETLRSARAVVDQIASVDRPEPLPSDFSLQVQRRILADSVRSRNLLGRDVWRLPRFAPVVAVVALVVVLLFAISKDRWTDVAGDDTTSIATSTGELSLVNIADLVERYGNSVEGPLPVEAWDPSGAPGVYMLMHKPDPGGLPDTYSMDYCGESSQLLSFRGNPWVRQRQGRLIARAGSRDNVFIVVIVLPESSGTLRRRIEKDLHENYQPYFNRRNGV